ncbi:unnamed protein product [Trichogramma brassicae]|uniref:C2H2-type domain-containing protein n=1 Tax=Trichogramma brassicae TaxID=86971 RepID=A0A6H5IE86_9HYME|nr:unnamed protein product [Trichogramma brassicae]
MGGSSGKKHKSDRERSSRDSRKRRRRSRSRSKSRSRSRSYSPVYDERDRYRSSSRHHKKHKKRERRDHDSDEPPKQEPMEEEMDDDRGTWNQVDTTSKNNFDGLKNYYGQTLNSLFSDAVPVVAPVQIEAILDEPTLDQGIGSALKFAMSKGYLEKEENNRATASRFAHLQAQKYSIEDKTHGEDDKFNRRDRFSGPTMDFKEKDGFKPNVKLEYIDDNGHLLNAKEAFRYLSHKFHGKGPGKNKVEKRMKKNEQESLLKRMSSTDTPLGTLNLLQAKQKETQLPFIVLSGSKQVQTTVHEGRRDFACDKCEKKFGERGSLIKHQKVVHEGRRDHACDQCDKKCSSKWSLLSHQKVVHEGRKDYVCDKCEKKFGYKRQLLLHQKIVHEGRKDYACNECEKKFGHKLSLLYHHKASHDGRKNYACNECEKKFRHQPHLLRHQKIVHEGCKDYACNKCEKKFGLKSSLLGHQKAVHEGRKDYSCDKCEKKFGLKSNLLGHQKTVHEANTKGETPLHIICKEDKTAGTFAELLFELSAESNHSVAVDSEDISGKRPLDYAVESNNGYLARMLEKNGADRRLVKNRKQLTLLIEKVNDSIAMFEMQELIRSRNERENLIAARQETTPPIDEIVDEKKLVKTEEQTPLDADEIEHEMRMGVADIKVPFVLDSTTSRPGAASGSRRIGRCTMVGRSVQVDAQDNAGRTTLQLAVAHLKPNAVFVLFHGGADRRSFEFPTAAQFQEGLGRSWMDIWRNVDPDEASRALRVVRHLATSGYILDQDDAVPIMEYLVRHRVPRYTIEDPSLTRNFFRPHAWTLLHRLFHGRLILDCCEPIIDNPLLTNQDKYNICLAAIVHEGCRDYECDKCEKKFGQKSTLLFHQKVTHEGRKDYSCDKCEKKFGRKLDLFKHQQIVHEGRKDYECDKCEKNFGLKGHLIRHQKTVHEGRKDYACDKCEKKFGQKGQLPNLRDIFQSEEIDWLLTEEIENDKNSSCNFTGWPLVQFVIRAGYRDEPDVDEDDGTYRLRRTTPLHRAVVCTPSEWNIKIRALFKIYDCFDANYSDESGLTHFHVACKYGCDEVVEQFLELGQDPDCVSEESDPSSVDPPLLLALMHERKKVIELLLTYGADPNQTSKDGSTSLHLIWVQSHVDIMEIFFKVCDEILETVRVDARDKLGRTPLYLALQRSKNKAAEILLRRGADPNSTDAEGSTPLHAMCNNHRDASAEIFFKICDEERKSVRVDAQDKLGQTSLHLAVRVKNRKLVELLLRRGADPNLAKAGGLTTLHIMCKKGKDRWRRWGDDNESYDEEDYEDDYYRNNDSDDDYIDAGLVELFFQITDEMQQSVKVDAVDKKGNTPLHYALHSGEGRVVELLLRNGADPNLADAEGLTYLHIICEENIFFRNCRSALKMFFEVNNDKHQKLQVDAREKGQHTAAFGSEKIQHAYHGVRRSDEDDHYDLLKKFFEVSNVINQPVRVDAFDKEGNTPLHLALNRNIADRTIITLLLRNGANPNLADAKGSTALHVICQSYYNKEDTFVKILFAICDEIHQTVQIDARDKLGRTPLHLALSHDYNTKAELLLRRGASPNSVDAHGSTPLHVICKKYREEYNFVKIFFEIYDEKHLTVQIDARDNVGRTPLYWALDRRHKNVAELLLRRGADPNLADAEGLTPLHMICQKEDDKNDELLKLFFKINDDIERTVQVDARDSNGSSPLHMALGLGKKEATELLLRRGADHNLADDDGSTPLHVICQRKDGDDLLKIFFKHNCELRQTLDARDVVGRTPLHWAVASLLPDMVDFLLNSGADASGFVFPTESHFVNKYTFTLERETLVFRTISIVESLEKRGYQLDQTAALTIIKTFAKHGLIDMSVDLDECLYSDVKFAMYAKEKMVNPNLTLYDFLQLPSEEAVKLITIKDYAELTSETSHISYWSRCRYILFLSEIVTIRFFRRWAAQALLELMGYQLPILCCYMIVEKLKIKELWYICQAALLKTWEELIDL